MFEWIREDIRTVFAKDPAARSTLEIITCYPGLQAIWLHRASHHLWTRRLHLLARLLSQAGRFLTGVEIHPGATIGRRFFIDHGMGVVIGETSQIGDDVLMYQGVVLGGTSDTKGKRHPTIGNNVVIGSGSIVLGPITVADGARVGAGSVVVKPVPAGMTVVGVPARIAGPKSPIRPETELSHGQLPDPGLLAISELLARQEDVERRLAEMERRAGEHTAAIAPPRPAVRAPDQELVRRIRESLREVLDPEVGINVVDLGLIQSVLIGDHDVEIRMKLTSGACPVADLLMNMVQHKTEEIIRHSSLDSVRVVLVNGNANDR
ncbi:MAG: serine O-acetyltransferase [Anaerolineae bacterium]|nr:serine O-acetyltransferase [Anaerolineae bacterium]